MEKQISWIDPLRAGQIVGMMSAVLGLLLSSIFVVTIFLLFFMSPELAMAFAGFPLLLILSFPIILGNSGFVFGGLGAVACNLVARWEAELN